MIRSGWFAALLDLLGHCDWRVPLVGAWAVFLLFPRLEDGLGQRRYVQLFAAGPVHLP